MGERDPDSILEKARAAQASCFVMATVHPSSILRAPDEESRREEMHRFIGDLIKAARVLAGED